MWPLAVSANSTAAWTSSMAWLIFTTRSRSQRSAAAPAIGAITITGKKSANATTPSQKPEFGQLPGQPADRDPLHPHADERHRAAERIDAEVRVAERKRNQRRAEEIGESTCAAVKVRL